MWLSKFVMGNRINNPVTIENLFKIVYQPIMVYWYLYVLIVLYIVFSIFKITYIKESNVVVFAVVAIIIKYLNLQIGIFNAVLYHVYFWVLGGYIASSGFLSKLTNSKIVICLVICFANVVIYFQHYALISIVSILKGVILATGATILLFLVFNNDMYNLKNMLNTLGNNVLAIYLVHCFITGGLRVIFKLLQIDNLFLYFVLGILLGIVVPIIMVKVCSKHIFLSMLFSPVNGLKKLGVVKA